VILGWTPGQGGRTGSFGALLVGAIDDGSMRWVGQVGTGFNHQMLDRLMDQLAPLVRADAAIDDAALRRIKGATFVEPELVCEVEYLEITKSSGKMRAPSFRGLRPDKTPDECLLEPAAFDEVRRKRR
jgi:bifunctional non-homologous end joining protein LigD